jgi:hypothetical protein
MLLGRKIGPATWRQRGIDGDVTCFAVDLASRLEAFAGSQRSFYPA